MKGAGSTRADVAAVAVLAATAPACVNVTFEMACDAPSKTPVATPAASSLFASLDPAWEKQWL